MKTKKDITADIDLIIGKNNEVTDDTHMDLVDEISDYIASQQQVPQDREECCTNYKQYLLEQIKEKDIE